MLVGYSNRTVMAVGLIESVETNHRSEAGMNTGSSLQARILVELAEFADFP